MNENINPSHEMMRIIFSKWISKPVYVAAELGLADILAAGPKPIGEIAEECGAHEPYLYRVMRALASNGIFTEIENRTFALTPMAECLQSSKMRAIARMFMSSWHESAWEKLLFSVQTGKNAFEAAHGQDAFSWFGRNPEAVAIFNEANASKIMANAHSIKDAYDFSEVRTIVDVGGGSGALLTTILEANEELDGTIADLPFVLRNAKERIRAANLEGRCSTVECDFFIEVPTGRDLYILSNIIHDWDDESSLLILRNCKEAMGKDSKLLIIEMIIPEGNEPSISKLLDIEVMVMGGGMERTKAEYEALLAEAGLYISKIIPTGDENVIMECKHA